MKKTYLLLAALVLLLSGCSKLTKENYDQIKPGMSYEEVVAIIGKPDHCSEVIALSNCEWKEGDVAVHISFIGGKATIMAAEGLK